MKGYDVYQFDLEIEDLFEYIYINNISIFRMNKNTFYSTIKYRKLLLEHPHIHYKYSIGIMGMFFRFNTEKMISFILSCILLFSLSNTIFDIEIIGESINHNQMIQENLSEFKIPFFYYNNKRLNHQLQKLNDHLNWYEIIRNGSNIQIHYLPRYETSKPINRNLNLIAEKEGVIAHFDIRKGNKVVSLNQKVNKGDLLVSNVSIDTSLNEETSDVIGNVYAYTFLKVDVEVENKFPVGIGYFICLWKSRIQLELENDEKIIQEISLHFSEDFDTIRMSNYYILYENISIVGD